MKRLLLSCCLLTLPNLVAAQDNACMESTSIDSCVVGTWSLSRGGPIAWMQGLCGMIKDATKNKIEGEGRDVRATVTYYADGSYEANAGGFRMDLHGNGRTHTHQPDHVTVRGDLQPATGRWSVSGTTLNNCQDSGGLTGATYAEGTEPGPTSTTSVPGMGDISMDYNCSESALKTSMSMGFMTGEERSVFCTFGLLGEYVDGLFDSSIRNSGDDFPMVMEFVRVD